MYSAHSPNQIARPRLIHLLNRGMDRALILVSAPAGYSKTTLVSGWLKDIHVSSTWLSLDEDDNDPIRFLQNFLAALHRIIPALPLDHRASSSLLLDDSPAKLGEGLYYI